MAARHFKYFYKSEIPPKTILSKMLEANIDDSNNNNNENESNRMNLNIERNKFYFSRRKEIKNLMKLVNSHTDNNSQTLFLTLYYMDLIFTHKDLEKVFYNHFKLCNNNNSFNDIQINNYVLLSLACLIIASKYTENDPHVPTMSSFIRLLYQCSNKKYIFNVDSLFIAEVVVIKLLQYKLNYYTIYHYLIFFFTHGIIFKKTIENSEIYKKYSERKILEKIYIQAREILDRIVEHHKYFYLFFGKDNYKIVVEIFLWSIEHIMNIILKDDENIFKLVYNINIDENEHKEIYELIEKIYKRNKKKNIFGNNNCTKVEGLNTNNIRKSTDNSKTSNSINIFSNKSQNQAVNLKYIEYKQNESNVPSFYDVKNNFFFSSEIKANKKEQLAKYNSNSNSQCKVPHIHHTHTSVIKQERLEPQSASKYGSNNRYLTSKKNLTNDSSIRKINNIKEKNKKSFNIENERYNKNNDKTHNNKNLNNYFGNINNLDKIDINSKKIIMTVNELTENREQSLSCSKNIFNMLQINYNYESLQSADFNNSNNIKTQLNIVENYKKDNELNGKKKEIYNYYNNNFTPNNNKIVEENVKKEKNKKNIFKKFKSLNDGGKFLSDKNIAKFADITFIKKPKEKTGTKMNQNLKFASQDNKKGITDKFYYDSVTKNNIIKY